MALSSHLDGASYAVPLSARVAARVACVLCASSNAPPARSALDACTAAAAILAASQSASLPAAHRHHIRNAQAVLADYRVLLHVRSGGYYARLPCGVLHVVLQLSPKKRLADASVSEAFSPAPVARGRKTRLRA